MIVGDIRIKTVDQPHGNIFSTGFRFETIGSSISYSTDFHVFTDAMLELFSRTDIWVVDALRERPHPTHIHLGATLDAILAVQPGQAILTHMDHSMDYASLCTTRSEERRVGTECVSPCRSRWSPDHYKKNKTQIKNKK